MTSSSKVETTDQTGLILCSFKVTWMRAQALRLSRLRVDQTGIQSRSLARTTRLNNCSISFTIASVISSWGNYRWQRRPKSSSTRQNNKVYTLLTKRTVKNFLICFFPTVTKKPFTLTYNQKRTITKSAKINSLRFEDRIGSTLHELLVFARFNSYFEKPDNAWIWDEKLAEKSFAIEGLLEGRGKCDKKDLPGLDSVLCYGKIVIKQ